ncbi:MAG: dTDP-4-dehydro-6-deoxyglucose aminotransferase [Rhodospirillaceae bacterium]|nr:dTDP-4-dehydro-6-deoxyglucose aminotransferase [Rhodospirillaceae bacterium]
MNKKSILDLAIFGGSPLFLSPVHANRPNVGDVDHFFTSATSIFKNRILTNNGPLARELEEKLCRYLRVRNCILTANGTSGLSMLIKALDLKGEVIIPSFTFISTAHALMWSGIRPVFCDVDPVTWSLDAGASISLISEHTTAIIGTHIWGRACDVARLENLCAERGIHLLFDAAHAFGCTYRGEPIGRFGTAEVFSFHATKVFHTFEGGAVTTDDDALAERLRKLRNFGFGDYDRVDMLGTNAKMSEIHAAMGLANLASIETTIDRCRSVWEEYRTALNGVRGLTVYARSDSEKSNYHYVVAEISQAEFGLSRDQLVDVLHSENIYARRYFYPGCHRAEPYRSLFPGAEAGLPQTREIGERVIVFPGGASMEAYDAAQICALIRFVADKAEEVASSLAVKDGHG